MTEPRQWPQPSYPPQPAPYPGYPPPKSRHGWIIGLTIGTVLLLCLCGVGVIGGLGYLGYRLDRTDAVAALTQYLEEIRDQNYEAAYDRLCDEAKAGASRAEYGQHFPPPRLVSFQIGAASNADRSGEVGHNVQVKLHLDDGQVRTERYFVFSRSGDVNRYYICPPGS